jgi:transcriptional regulator with XRE-family HTH domain
MTASSFGTKVKKALQESDITRKQASEKLDITASQISNWILGKSSPTIEKFAELIRITGKDPNYFFGYPSISIDGSNKIYGNNSSIQIAHNSEDIEFLKKEIIDLRRQFNFSKKRK